MASQSNPASTRRFALKDISLNAVNKASPQGAGRLGLKAGNPEKPSKLVEASRLEQSSEGAIHDPVRGEARLGGQKRVLELVQTHDRPDAKRFKDGHTIARGPASGDRVADLEEGVDDHVQPVRDVRSEDAVFHLSADAEAPHSPCLSQASSIPRSQSVLNDSQTTTVTEPDDSRAWIMRGEELRQRARALKLRLSLANYKVQTNQIDTPISQLQIKTTSTSTDLPALPRAASTPRNRPLSSTSGPSNIPNILLPNPAKTRLFTSSPPRYIEAVSDSESGDEPPQAVATPLLPRQRQSLLNPPFLGDFEDRSPARDLTSSVVKGRAAKGLLSLMGHQS